MSEESESVASQTGMSEESESVAASVDVLSLAAKRAGDSCGGGGGMTIPKVMQAMVLMGHGDMDQYHWREDWPVPVR